MAKAILLHSATDQGNPGPDYDTGWGLLNVESAVNLLNNGSSGIFNRQITNNRSEAFFFDVDAGKPSIKVTMVWTDPSASTGAANALVNDLDMRLISPYH